MALVRKVIDQSVFSNCLWDRRGSKGKWGEERGALNVNQVERRRASGTTQTADGCVMSSSVIQSL